MAKDYELNTKSKRLRRFGRLGASVIVGAMLPLGACSGDTDAAPKPTVTVTKTVEAPGAATASEENTTKAIDASPESERGEVTADNIVELNLDSDQLGRIRRLAKATLSKDIATFQEAISPSLTTFDSGWTYAFATDPSRYGILGDQERKFAIKFGPTEWSETSTHVEGQDSNGPTGAYRVLVESFEEPIGEELMGPDGSSSETIDNIETHEYVFRGNTPDVQSIGGLEELLSGKLVGYNASTRTDDGDPAYAYITLVGGEGNQSVYTWVPRYNPDDVYAVSPVSPDHVMGVPNSSTVIYEFANQVFKW